MIQNRALHNDFFSEQLCKELMFIHRCVSVAGYRPHVLSTTILDVLLAEPAMLPAVVRARQLVWDAVEHQFDRHCEVFVEHTSLISWTAGASIGWHHDSNRPYLTQRHFSAVAYLNTAQQDFTGGTFCFESGPPPLQVHPQAGQLLLYTADEANVHCVLPVTAGERMTFTMWFTLDAAYQEDTKVLTQLAAPGVRGSGLPDCLYLLQQPGHHHHQQQQQQAQHRQQDELQPHQGEYAGQQQQQQHKEEQVEKPEEGHHQQTGSLDVRLLRLQQLGVALVPLGPLQPQQQHVHVLANTQQQPQQHQHQQQLLPPPAPQGSAAAATRVSAVAAPVPCTRLAITSCTSHMQDTPQQGQQQDKGLSFGSIKDAVRAVHMVQWRLCTHRSNPHSCLSGGSPEDNDLFSIDDAMDSSAVAATETVEGDSAASHNSRRCPGTVAAAAAADSCGCYHDANILAAAQQQACAYLSHGKEKLEELLPCWLAAGALVMKA